MKTDTVDRKLWPMAVMAVLLFVALEARLAYLQIFRGKDFRRLSDENRLRIEKIPAPRGIIYDRNGVPLVKNSAYYSVALLPETLEAADLDKIAVFLNIGREEIDEKVKKAKPFEPIKLKEGLAFAEVAYIESRLSDYPALSIYAEQARRYLYGETGAHLVGFLGKLGPKQAKDPAFKDIPRQAFIGQWGIEKLYDGILRGTPGRRALEVDAFGRYLRIINEERPVKGNDIYLAVDINLQRSAEEALKDNAGAVVALKPDTGEVLALVSRPSFDPNAFTGGITGEQWTALQNDPRFPMLNRALQSQYPPGSTFKIVTAIAALEDEAVTEETKAVCSGGIYYGRWRFGCWRKEGHGVVSLRRALVDSCDVYFYRAGEKTGIDAIASYARKLGLGRETGIKLVAEKQGNIPDSRWKLKNRGEPWYLGETYNAAIGQGYVLVTPAQMARMMSTVSNGGYLYKLSLLRLDEPPEPVGEAKLKEDTLIKIKDALSGVVKEGTGGAAASKTVEIGGKTGTAQVVSLKWEDSEKFRDHAWFVAFAPLEKPEIAISVFVEHGGHGGSAAAPIAKKAIEAYLGAR